MKKFFKESIQKIWIWLALILICTATINISYTIDKKQKNMEYLFLEKSYNSYKKFFSDNFLTYDDIVFHQKPLFLNFNKDQYIYYFNKPIGVYFPSKDIHQYEYMNKYIPLFVVLSGAVILGLCFWALWSLKRSKVYADILVAEKTTQLLESEKQFRNAIEYSPIGNAIVSPSGAFLKVNKALCKIMGYSEDELLKLDFQQITHPDDLEDDLASVTKLLKDEIDSYEMEKRYFRKDGYTMNALLSVSLVRNEDNSPRYFISQIQDITEKKLAEQEILRSNAELQRFAYIASHDLQEPLRMIRNFTDLYVEEYYEDLDKQAKYYLKYVVDASVRMQNLINDLLEYSKANSQDTNITEFKSKEQIDSALDNLKGIIKETNTKITVQELPTLNGNPIRFSRLIENLIGNAIKYRHDERSPKINIKAQECEAEWLFSVQDNGIGINKDYLKQIFVIFKRLHNKNKYTGTGIGLAICQKIVADMGGSIWVESVEGAGSTFFFTIPKSSEIAIAA